MGRRRGRPQVGGGVERQSCGATERPWDPETGSAEDTLPGDQEVGLRVSSLLEAMGHSPWS